MFDLEEFNEHQSLRLIVAKLNKFILKKKESKISKLIEELESLLDDPELMVQVTYILSIIAENKIEWITGEIISKISEFFTSDNTKLRLNSIIIIGFFILSNHHYLNDYSFKFVKLLLDTSDKDIRDNGHYFLHEFVKLSPDFIKKYKNLIIKALSVEKSEENVSSLLDFIDMYEILDFKQSYNFREVLKELITDYIHDRNSTIFIKVSALAKKFFPFLNEESFSTLKEENLLKEIDNLFLMEKHNFSEINKKKGIRLKDYINKFKRSRLKDKEIYFYIKNQETNQINFYELEKDKLLSFFEKNNKISLEKLKEVFPMIESGSELKTFLKMLIKLEHINGYLSKFYFYPYNFLKSEIITTFQQKGIVNLKNYNFLPPEFVENVIVEAGTITKQQILKSTSGLVYYSLKNINTQINTTAAKSSSIDLIAYRDRLSPEDFIKLIKHLPREYLTNYRKGTHWLTNIGKIKIEKEIENSKIVGFFDIGRISERLNLKKILLMDILELYIDQRSGIWDNTKEIFYFSKYLTDKIEGINIIAEEEEKIKQINLLARELNIHKNHILTKIDENLRLIGEEIKEQEQVKISEYLEKTGMELNIFMDFINTLDLSYFIKGDLLILSASRIEDAKKGIKSMLIDKSKSLDYITFGNFDINSNLIEQLIRELTEDGKLKGIFYDDEGDIKFYTVRGIKSRMMEDVSFILAFHDLFLGKELSTDDIELLIEVFKELVREENLKGKFDEDTLTYSSSDMLFANDYNTVFYDFEKFVNKYIHKFDFEFQKIRKILIKRDEIIYPQEIKVIQESIDKINGKYIFWRDYIEAFVRKANIDLLRVQKSSPKQYKALSEEKKAEFKSFENDPEVYDIRNGFNSWIKLFNELELKYTTAIFHQKKLLNNPEDKESEEKLNELSIELNLI